KEYEITIDNPVVAKVENGKIVGQFEGQTAFSVKLKGLNRSAVGYLKVIDNTNIELKQENYIIGIGQNLMPSFQIIGPNQNSYITIDNPIVARVENGKIVGQFEGQTAFEIRLNNSTKFVRGYLKVEDNSTIKFNKENYIINMYEYVDLDFSISGTNKEYNIVIDNPVIAKVEKGNKIKGINSGQTAFEIRLNNSSKFVKGYLKVEDNLKISLNNENYFSKVGELVTLDVRIVGAIKEYDIIIDNKAVAILENGKIKAISEGQTAFTLKLKGTNKTTTGYLKVEK
ncbi:MAG: hypothetical protein RSD14_00020, partial [Clostridia bacterium]